MNHYCPECGKVLPTVPRCEKCLTKLLREAVAPLVTAVAHIVAMDNCNYDGNTMRQQGAFEALREPLAKVQEMMKTNKEDTTCPR